MAESPWIHPNSKEWTKTFEMARDYGWHAPTHTSDHPKFVLECPQEDKQCRIVAYSTTTAGRVARTARAKIRRCPHLPKEFFEEVRRRVAEGERLVELLEASLKERINKATVEDLLAELEATLEPTDRALQAYVQADDNSKSDAERVRQLRRPNDPELLVEVDKKAGKELKRSRKELDSKPSQHPTWMELDGRVSEARKLLAGLRTQMRDLLRETYL